MRLGMVKGESFAETCPVGMGAFVTALRVPRITLRSGNATCTRNAGRRRLCAVAVAVAAPPRPAPLEQPDAGIDGAVEISGAQQFLALQASAAATGQTCYVLFRAQHCRACKAVTKKFVAWASQRGTVATVRVDATGGRELASRLGVHQVPVVQVYSGARLKTEEYVLTMKRMQQMREEGYKTEGETSVPK